MGLFNRKKDAGEKKAAKTINLKKELDAEELRLLCAAFDSAAIRHPGTKQTMDMLKSTVSSGKSVSPEVVSACITIVQEVSDVMRSTFGLNMGGYSKLLERLNELRKQ